MLYFFSCCRRTIPSAVGRRFSKPVFANIKKRLKFNFDLSFVCHTFISTDYKPKVLNGRSHTGSLIYLKGAPGSSIRMKSTDVNMKCLLSYS